MASFCDGNVAWIGLTFSFSVIVIIPQTPTFLHRSVSRLPPTLQYWILAHAVVACVVWSARRAERDVMGGCGFLLVTGEDMHAGFSRQEIARGAITMQLGRKTGQYHYECSRCGRMCHPAAITAFPKTRQSVLPLLRVVQTFPVLSSCAYSCFLLKHLTNMLFLLIGHIWHLCNQLYILGVFIKTYMSLTNIVMCLCAFPPVRASMQACVCVCVIWKVWK